MTQSVNREILIKNRQGLHLRLACRVAQEAQQFSCSILLDNGRQTADAKSILEMILLAAGPGTNLQIQAEGADARRALEQIESVLQDSAFENSRKMATQARLN